MGAMKSALLEECGVTWDTCMYCDQRMSARGCSDRDDTMHAVCRKKYEAEAQAKQREE